RKKERERVGKEGRRKREREKGRGGEGGKKEGRKGKGKKEEEGRKEGKEKERHRQRGRELRKEGGREGRKERRKEGKRKNDTLNSTCRLSLLFYIMDGIPHKSAELFLLFSFKASFFGISNPHSLNLKLSTINLTLFLRGQ
ncbi:hypothetical protein L345_13818, partial [Ophiophagus hannah]